MSYKLFTLRKLFGFVLIKEDIRSKEQIEI